MRMMVATWWMICSLKSCTTAGGGHTGPNPPHSPIPTAPKVTQKPPRRGWGGIRGSHLAFDIRSDAEEQRPIEGELDHVVPILGGQDALKAKDGLGGSEGFQHPSPSPRPPHRHRPNPVGAAPGVRPPPRRDGGEPLRSVGIRWGAALWGGNGAGGAHLDGVPLPHLPEVVEPRLLCGGGREKERGVNGGAGGAPGTAVGGTTHIHYDSHASNESKKVKRESPTGKRKQTVLRGAAGRGEGRGRTHCPHPPPPRMAPSRRRGAVGGGLHPQGTSTARPGSPRLPELLEQAGPVLVAAAAEPTLHLAHRAAALPRQHLHVSLGGGGDDGGDLSAAVPPSPPFCPLPPRPPPGSPLTCLGCLDVAA